MTNKPLLLTGIQPTNRLTLGNYLGAIKNIIREQDNYDCYVFVADWHSTTIPLNLQQSGFKQIEENKNKLLKMLVACGIDPTKSRLFVQSAVKEHLELFYFLLTHSVVGELQRMTQYKHLSKKFVQSNKTEMALVGLMIYPVLMCADILIYDTDYVAIGEDQTQHLELTVNIAERINNKYKPDIFKLPKAFNPVKNKAGIKIKDLQDPSIKMSKSNKDYTGVIFLDDDLDEVREKIMKAKTDSVGEIKLDKENQPGVVNLLEIYAGITEISLEEAFERLKRNTYKELKEVVAEVVVKELKQIQDRLKNIDEKELMQTVQKNNEHCIQKARAKISFIRNSI